MIMQDQTDKANNITITGDGNVVGNKSSSHVQKGGIHADRIEADNVVDGVQLQGGTPEMAANLIQAAKAIQRGGITAKEIKAGNVVSGLQFLTGKPPETQADLRAEVAALREQVQQAIAAGEVADAGDAEDVTDALAKTEAELEKSEPNGKRVVRHLESATDILTGVAESTAAARNIGWQIIKLAPLAAALAQLAQAIF
jgi:predicted RNA-binding Zn ribbon-like protein